MQFFKINININIQLGFFVLQLQRIFGIWNLFSFLTLMCKLDIYLYIDQMRWSKNRV